MNIARAPGDYYGEPVEEPREFRWPHYPICCGCEEETDRNGFCDDCQQYHDGRLVDEPLSELKRNGTTGLWQ